MHVGNGHAGACRMQPSGTAPSGNSWPVWRGRDQYQAHPDNTAVTAGVGEQAVHQQDNGEQWRGWQLAAVVAPPPSASFRSSVSSGTLVTTRTWRGWPETRRWRPASSSFAIHATCLALSELCTPSELEAADPCSWLFTELHNPQAAPVLFDGVALAACKGGTGGGWVGGLGGWEVL